MRFEFATATRIVFGAGTLSEIGGIAAEMGRHALVVTGRSAERAGRLRDLLRSAGIVDTGFTFAGEPTVDTARSGANAAWRAHCDFVIGFGGGSAIDAGKAIAALMTNGGDPLDYLEGIGAGRALSLPSAPYIAIPTTAGTGAEVTRNAVLGSPEHRVKVSLRSATMLPRLALIDPELTIGLPPAVTATTGLDALTQSIEAYVSNSANPVSDLFSLEGVKLAAGSLQRCVENGADRDARRDMALAALYSGIALANARLGAVHGFAGPLGGMISALHGALCASLLPTVVSANIRALRERDPEGVALRRYEEVARLLTRDPDAAADDGAEWLAGLCGDLDIPRLGEFGLSVDDLPLLLRNAAKASSMLGNPIKLFEREMEEILLSAL